MALDVYNDMFPREEESHSKILHDLLDSTKNINMKTRANEPLVMAWFDVSALRFNRKRKDGKRMVKCYETVTAFSKIVKELMVSYPEGEGRKEVAGAIAGMTQQERNISMTERLLGMRKE